MSRCNFAHALFESESVHFGHVQRRLFAWHGQYKAVVCQHLKILLEVKHWAV